MALTINTSLKGAEGVINHTHLKDVYSWFDFISIISGYKEQSIIADFAFSGQILSDADCVVDSNDITVAAKEVPVNWYNFSLPVSRCDLHKTWLSAFADKYEGEENIFFENLRPYIVEKIGFEVREHIISDMINEAKNDTSVTKIAATAVTDEATAYSAIVDFVKAIPLPLKKKALDISWYEDTYVLYVDSNTFTLASLHLADKNNGGAYIYVGGFRVEADALLDQDQMYFTSRRNILAVFDDLSDVNKTKIISKEELNLDYIIGGIAVGGSYVNGNDILITDNF